MVISSINSETKKLGNLDINQLRPIDFVGSLGTPVFFIGGARDMICSLSQVRALFKAYGGPKQLKIVNQTHN